MSLWLFAGAAIALLAVGGAIYQAVGLTRDARAFPAPGRFFDAGDHRLHIVCRGEGAPTVILESAIGASSVSWSVVQPAVARFARVCAYDRAGLGWSDRPPGKASLARMLDALHAWLTTSDRTGPYVMVGHSFGAFMCLAYAARHPQQVCGLVLVDPPTEWMHATRRQGQMVQGAVVLSAIGAGLARVGVVRACLALLTGGVPAAPRYFSRLFGPTTARTLERLVGEVRKLPPGLHPIVQAAWCRPKCFHALADHMRVLSEVTAAASTVTTLGDLPMAVISSVSQPPDGASSHQALARLSSRGRVVVASRSGHWVPYDEPELLVETIRHIVLLSNPAA